MDFKDACNMKEWQETTNGKGVQSGLIQIWEIHYLRPGPIVASLGCDDDREGWHTYHHHGQEEQQHCGEGDTSVWQDQIKKRLNVPNLHN